MESLNRNSVFVPIFILFFSFFMLILSIYHIINIFEEGRAKEILINTKKLETVNNILQSNDSINYEMLKSATSVQGPNFSLQTDFHIPLETKYFAESKQNDFIRFQLIEWKINHLEKQLTEYIQNNSNSVLANFYTWLWGIIGLIFSTILIQIINHLTHKCIIEKFF
ncbi:hypothetical protein ACN4Z3_12325 [Legionella sp. 29fVS95]